VDSVVHTIHTLTLLCVVYECTGGSEVQTEAGAGRLSAG